MASLRSFESFVIRCKAEKLTECEIADLLNSPSCRVPGPGGGEWSARLIYELYYGIIVPKIFKKYRDSGRIDLTELQKLIDEHKWDFVKISRSFPGISPGELMAFADALILTDPGGNYTWKWVEWPMFSPREDAIIQRGIKNGLSSTEIAWRINIGNKLLSTPGPVRSKRSIEIRSRELAEHTEEDSTFPP